MSLLDMKIQSVIFDDLYTPDYAVFPILKYLKPASRILCPFDKENSSFVKILEASGHTVYYTHIDNQIDFFNIKESDITDIDYIISKQPKRISFKNIKSKFDI